MARLDSQADKDEDVPPKEEMVYCGEFELRESTKEVEDEIDGTLTITDGERAASGAKPGEYIWLRVQNADGDETTVQRKLHSNGRSVTLPLKARQQIGVAPGDTVRYWIDSTPDTVSTQPDSPSPKRSQADSEEYVLDLGAGGLTYHVVDADSEDETVCGLDLSDRDVRRFSDPGDALEICAECNVRASADMSNREIVQWLADTVDEFSPSGNNPSYLTKEQLVALRDHILELRDEVERDD
ncbi:MULTISPECIES: hypothetical protein [Halobacterium]|uniref:hypothetical protein n=1 Tax=Halobacterium TaxID=2239 RepID=UPI00073F55F5|nr:MULTISPECIES: hypothetical protein [Halobacterium]MCG1001919.1 hypothetical protein [Halobacterium noricense]